MAPSMCLDPCGTRCGSWFQAVLCHISAYFRRIFGVYAVRIFFRCRIKLICLCRLMRTRIDVADISLQRDLPCVCVCESTTGKSRESWTAVMNVLLQAASLTANTRPVVSDVASSVCLSVCLSVCRILLLLDSVGNLKRIWCLFEAASL